MRINEIAKKKEDEENKKSRLVLDKDSSARIVKRSLWQNAQSKAETEVKRLKTSD